MNKKKITMLTMISSVANVVIIALFGLIYNQKIIETYGSAVTGLISTLTQFVGLFTVLEGGFTTAALVAIYKPIVEKNADEYNSILISVKKYLNKLGVLIGVLSFFLGLIYIFIIDSPLTVAQTIALLLITVLTTTFSLSFQSRFNIIFNGFNKQYVLSLVSLFTKFITWIVAVVLILSQKNIVLVYGIYSSSIIINLIIYNFFTKAKFKGITFKGNAKEVKISGTKDVFIQKIASTLFTSTDLILISAGVGLASASVYNVYHQIFGMIGSLQSSVVESPFNSFGHLLHENNSKFKQYYELYLKVLIVCSTIILTAVGLTIVEFARVYTRNTTDINYIVPSVAILFYCQFFFNIINKPFGQLLNLSKKFKEQNFQCVLGAIVNLVVSILGMIFLGIEGIILGSILGTLIIFVFNYFKCVKGRFFEGGKTLLLIFANFSIGLFFIHMRLFCIQYVSSSYFQWFISSIISLLIVAIALLGVNCIFLRKDLTRIITMIKKYIFKRKNN